MRNVFFHIALLACISLGYAQTAPVPDPNFLTFLKTNFPAVIDGNDQLIISQANAVTSSFNCSNQNISNLEGLQYFINITSLDASDNALTSCPQISTLSKITKLDVKNNQITSLPSLVNLKSLRLFFVARNQLASFPSLDSNYKIEEIIAYNNLLTVLPSFSKLVTLQKIDLGNNRLTGLPDLSANLRLKFLSVDRNFLQDIPGLALLDSLAEVQVHQNYFTFTDLIPLLDNPGYPTDFTISPQRKIAHADLVLSDKDTLDLITTCDQNLSSISYYWYLNGSPIINGSKDTLYIAPSGKQYEGVYYAEIKSPDFPNLTLYTDSFTVSITACPSVSDFSFEYEKITCLKSGKLKVSLLSMPVENYIFKLSPVIGDGSLTSKTGVFEYLSVPEYHLQVKVGTQCLVNYPTVIQIPFEACEETFITPNDDGDKDAYYFSQKGTAKIIDKDGRVLSTLSLPGEWDGTIGQGKRVAPGYYLVNINNGETVVKISVLY